MLNNRLLPALFCILVLFPAVALAWTGDVVRIADGDTMTVMRQGEQVRVRFYGIDSMAFGFIMCPFPSSAHSAQAKS